MLADQRSHHQPSRKDHERESRGYLSKVKCLRQFWGRHFWARGYFAVSSGTITDDMINEYINEQEGEPVEDDGRFQIDPS